VLLSVGFQKRGFRVVRVLCENGDGDGDGWMDRWIDGWDDSTRADPDRATRFCVLIPTANTFTMLSCKLPILSCSVGQDLRSVWTDGSVRWK